MIHPTFVSEANIQPSHRLIPMINIETRKRKLSTPQVTIVIPLWPSAPDHRDQTLIHTATPPASPLSAATSSPVRIRRAARSSTMDQAAGAMEAYAPRPAELGQHRRGLRPGKLLADAHPRSGPEGQIGAARLAGTLRVETAAPRPGSPLSQRSGRNRSGSAHHRGSRCSRSGLTRHIVPAAPLRPPSVSGSSTRRLNIHDGGHSRSVSARTAMVSGSRSAGRRPRTTRRTRPTRPRDRRAPPAPGRSPPTPR